MTSTAIASRVAHRHQQVLIARAATEWPLEVADSLDVLTELSKVTKHHSMLERLTNQGARAVNKLDAYLNTKSGLADIIARRVAARTRATTQLITPGSTR